MQPGSTVSICWQAAECALLLLTRTCRGLCLPVCWLLLLHVLD